MIYPQPKLIQSHYDVRYKPRHSIPIRLLNIAHTPAFCITYVYSLYSTITVSSDFRCGNYLPIFSVACDFRQTKMPNTHSTFYYIHTMAHQPDTQPLWDTIDETQPSSHPGQYVAISDFVSQHAFINLCRRPGVLRSPHIIRQTLPPHALSFLAVGHIANQPGPLYITYIRISRPHFAFTAIYPINRDVFHERISGGRKIISASETLRPNKESQHQYEI